MPPADSRTPRLAAAWSLAAALVLPAALACTAHPAWAADPQAPVAASEVANITTEVYFGARSATLDAQGKAVLDQWLAAIQGITPSFILSIGHADPGEVQGALKAVKLSEARARAVRDYLARKGGFQPGQINVEGKGDTQPVSATGDAAERARNRRVDVGIVGRRG